MPSFPAITESARRWAEGFRPDAFTASPMRHLVVLCCMDARIDLFRLLGLQVGDAHILRNAGGRATDDMLRSIILSTNALGTREVVVIHHTGCGLGGVTDDEIREQVRRESGHSPTEIEFLAFDDEVQSVREDVARIRACEYLPEHMSVWGAVYDVHTGVLTPVDRTR